MCIENYKLFLLLISYKSFMKILLVTLLSNHLSNQKLKNNCVNIDKYK